MREISPEAVIARLIDAMDAKNETDLARRLDTTSSTISTWKKRDGVPLAKCEKLARHYGWSLDWLLYGEGDPPGTASASGMITETPREEAMLTLFRSLPEDEQREIQSAAEGKKRLRSLEQRMEEVTAAARLRSG